MTDYRKYMGKDYIGHWDLKEDGDTVVTIESVEQGELRNPNGTKKDRRPLVSFKGAEKKMVLNATNGKTIAAMYGNHVEAWVGKKIALYRTTTQVGPNSVECIRVRPQVPKQRRAEEAQSDD